MYNSYFPPHATTRAFIKALIKLSSHTNLLVQDNARGVLRPAVIPINIAISKVKILVDGRETTLWGRANQPNCIAPHDAVACGHRRYLKLVLARFTWRDRANDDSPRPVLINNYGDETFRWRHV